MSAIAGRAKPHARTQNDGFDLVTDEIELWERLSRDSFSLAALHCLQADGCHLSHKANVQQVFSRAGKLSVPNLDPSTLFTWL
jgi:hypothetical protein